jgi:hypothetical protein
MRGLSQQSTSLGEDIMSYGASIYSRDYKLPITAEFTVGFLVSKDGGPALSVNSASSQFKNEPQLVMDRLLRECLTRKSSCE